MTKLAHEWVQTNDPVIRSPARYRWTMAPALMRQVGTSIRITPPHSYDQRLVSSIAVNLGWNDDSEL